MRILIVEDNRTNLILMKKLMEPFGEIAIAVNGAEAIDLYDASITANQPYELIILDIMMPVVDGRSVLFHIRSNEQSHSELSKTKIVVASAMGDEDTVQTMVKYRCDAYLRKPIDRNILIERLHELDIWENNQPKELEKEEEKLG